MSGLLSVPLVRQEIPFATLVLGTKCRKNADNFQVSVSLKETEIVVQLEADGKACLINPSAEGLLFFNGLFEGASIVAGMGRAQHFKFLQQVIKNVNLNELIIFPAPGWRYYIMCLTVLLEKWRKTCPTVLLFHLENHQPDGTRHEVGILSQFAQVQESLNANPSLHVLYVLNNLDLRNSHCLLDWLKYKHVFPSLLIRVNYVWLLPVLRSIHEAWKEDLFTSWDIQLCFHFDCQLAPPNAAYGYGIPISPCSISKKVQRWFFDKESFPFLPAEMVCSGLEGKKLVFKFNLDFAHSIASVFTEIIA